MEVLLEIKKSKFYGYSFCVESKSQVDAILEKMKKEHKKATHICYAYSFFDEQIFAKYCDDGEPSGTAGKPIYNVIEKRGLKNILIVVVRYFGGIMLGAGGLVRAYSKTASEVAYDN